MGDAIEVQGKTRIMVVEDEKLVALALDNSLRNMGYDVPAVVSTGDEAVKRVREARPDLILMDIKLKGAMDGVEAAALIHDISDVPIIYLTAYSEAHTRERAKTTEPFGYLVKPFEERTLQATVEMALDKSTKERRLLRAKERLETILEGLTEGVVVVGPDGGVEYLNSAAQKVISPGRDLSPGTPLLEVFRVFDPETLESITLPIPNVLEGAQPVYLNGIVLATAESGRIHVNCELAPLRDHSKAVRGMVLSFRDVSKRGKGPGATAEGHDQGLEHRPRLLPGKEEGLPGLKHGWMFHASNAAAGDLLNVFTIDKEHAGFYLIDVPGRAITSRVNSLLLQRFLTPDGRGEAWLPLLDARPLSPRDVAEKLVRRVSNSTFDPFFCLQYGTVQAATGAVTLVITGGAVPIWQKRDGSLGLVRALDRSPEASGEIPAEEDVLTLDHGDRLFLYSDGLVSCANSDGVPFTEDRLISLLRKTRILGLSEAVAEIDAHLMRWRAQDEFDDDVCLLGIERS